MTDKLSEYGWGFQVKVVAAMFTDRMFLQQIADIIQADYFESEANTWIMEIILEHFREYKTPPTKDVLKVKVTDIDNDVLKTAVLEQLKEVFRYMESDDLTFVKDEILRFCKNQEIKRAIMDSVSLLKMGNYDEIKTKIDGAMKAGADTDIGLEYKNDVAVRYQEAARDTMTTGWDVIDDLMDGGLAPGELGVVMAPAGIGKSWLLINIGANAMKSGKNVIHYTLELNENYVGQRYDSVVTGINAQNLKNYQEDIQDKMDQIQGDLVIKYYPTKSVGVMGIKAHIEKTIMLGNKPDLVIVDYADLLKVNQKDKHEALEELYEDLRGMAGEYGVPVWTATQANRSALEEDVIEADKIASSYGKVMVSDFLMSLSRKVEDKMSGTGRGHVIKNRFGPDGITLPCKMKHKQRTISYSLSHRPHKVKQTTKIMKTGENIVKKNLAQKFKDLGGTLG